VPNWMPWAKATPLAARPIARAKIQGPLLVIRASFEKGLLEKTPAVAQGAWCECADRSSRSISLLLLRRRCEGAPPSGRVPEEHGACRPDTKLGTGSTKHFFSGV
jgi:hypothetical protein